MKMFEVARWEYVPGETTAYPAAFEYETTGDHDYARLDYEGDGWCCRYGRGGLAEFSTDTLLHALLLLRGVTGYDYRMPDGAHLAPASGHRE